MKPNRMAAPIYAYSIAGSVTSGATTRYEPTMMTMIGTISQTWLVINSVIQPIVFKCTHFFSEVLVLLCKVDEHQAWSSVKGVERSLPKRRRSRWWSWRSRSEWLFPQRRSGLTPKQSVSDGVTTENIQFYQLFRFSNCIEFDREFL